MAGPLRAGSIWRWPAIFALPQAAAKMGETYIKLGLNPGNGGTYFLPRLVGSGMAAEMALTGDIVDAERALEIGLVNRVVEPDAAG